MGGRHYLTVPTTYREYTGKRDLKGILGYEVHRTQLRKYGIGEPDVGASFDAFFATDPRVYVKGLLDKQRLDFGEPDYVIHCYDSYPLINRYSSVLYHKKALSFRQAQAFSFCNQGAMSPVSGIRWADIQSCSMMMICSEQIYDAAECWRLSEGYPRADALALFQVTPHSTDLQLLMYGTTRYAPVNDHSGQLTADHSFSFINAMLDGYGIHHEICTIVPQSVSDHYEASMCEIYPNLFCKRDKVNLSTCDVWYSLEELYHVGIETPFIVLNPVDTIRKQVGCILLRYEPLGNANEKSSRRTSGENGC